MTNDEIDLRLKTLAEYMPKHAQHLYKMTQGYGDESTLGVRNELELVNMSLMAISAMLGEIAKRLPEPTPCK